MKSYGSMYGIDCSGSGAPRERTLRNSATGLVKDQAIVIGKLNHGSLLNTPSGDLHARGTFVEQNKLIRNLDSGPVTIPDGYSSGGSIEAELVAASPT